jgi:hypothetical protein
MIYRPYQKAISDYLERINYAGFGNSPALTVASPAPIPAPTVTPALPAPVTNGNGNGKSVRERLADLKGLLEDGLIDQSDFDSRKAAILAEV